MPRTYCSVPGCDGRGGHRFPNDLVRLQEWIIAIRRVNWSPRPSNCVCTAHFDETDYLELTQGLKIPARRKLTSAAVPHIFPWTTPSSNVPVRIRQKRGPKVKNMLIKYGNPGVLMMQEYSTRQRNRYDPTVEKDHSSMIALHHNASGSYLTKSNEGGLEEHALMIPTPAHVRELDLKELATEKYQVPNQRIFHDDDVPAISNDSAKEGSIPLVNIKTEPVEMDSSDSDTTYSTDYSSADHQPTDEKDMPGSSMTAALNENDNSSRDRHANREKGIQVIHCREPRAVHPISVINLRHDIDKESNTDGTKKELKSTMGNSEKTINPNQDTQDVLECMVCQEKTKNGMALRFHILDHQRDLLKKFNGEENYHEHSDFDTAIKRYTARLYTSNYKCPICNLHFKDWNSQLYHSKAKCGLRFKEWSHGQKKDEEELYSERDQKFCKTICYKDCHYIECQDDSLKVPSKLMYKCLLCEDFHTDSTDLVGHVMGHVDNYQRTKRKTLQDKGFVNKMNVRGITWRCPLCREHFDGRNKFQYHTDFECKIEFDEVKLSYTCLQCNSSHKTIKLLRNHVYRHLIGERQKKELEETKQSEVRKRVEERSSERKKARRANAYTYQCEDCDEGFDDWNMFRFHCQNLGHPNVKPWESDVSFHTEISQDLFNTWKMDSEKWLARYRDLSNTGDKNYCGDNSISPMTSVIPERLGSNATPCLLVSNVSQLKENPVKIFPVEEPPLEELDKSLMITHVKESIECLYNTCTICGEVNLNGDSYRSHIMLHQDKFKHSCESCISGFNDKIVLENHLIEIMKDNLSGHRQQSQPDCPFCGSKCHCSICKCRPNSNICDYRRTTKKYYICCVCGTEQETELSFIRHMWSHKSGTFSCCFCLRVFKSKNELDEHYSSSPCQSVPLTNQYL